MDINIQTKVSDVIQENEKAIDVISSINSHFRKLKNPILRKLLASKVSLEQVARIGQISNETLLDKLKGIGFILAESPLEEETTKENIPFKIDPENLITLDVRPYIEAGSDPFSIIKKEIHKLSTEQTLVLINTFEPVPLINLLESQGISSLVYKESEVLYKTYFQKSGQFEVSDETMLSQLSYTTLLEKLTGKLKEIDVRKMSMPYPMMTILNELTELEKGHGLMVHHKRIPQFLLPKLDEQHLEYAMYRIDEEYVMMIIAKD